MSDALFHCIPSDIQWNSILHQLSLHIIRNRMLWFDNSHLNNSHLACHTLVWLHSVYLSGWRNEIDISPEEWCCMITSRTWYNTRQLATSPGRYVSWEWQTLPSVGLMLGHRRRRWPNNKPTLGRHLVCAGMVRAWLNTAWSVHKCSVNRTALPTSERLGELHRKRQTFNQCWINVCPAFQTLGQH